MAHAITMPALSDTMSNGRLVKWTKKSRDKIKKGDVIAEVETDKAVMEVEAFQDGYLSGPLAAEGTEAPVGQTIGYIADNLDEIARDGANAVTAPQPGTSNGKTAQPAEQARVSAVLAASRASLQTAPRTGSRRPAPRQSSEPAVLATPTANPLLAAIEAGPPYRLERASSLREAVAHNMIASASTPSFRIAAQLSLQPLIAAAKANSGYSVSLLLARACALTIAAHPLFNAAYTPDGLARRDRVDVGIAIDSGDGLITPVLRDAAGRSLAELAENWGTLRDRAKARRLVPADYRGATFYLSNLGVVPLIYAFDSIIPTGASAILSVAAATKDGTILTLSCDHRVVFGGDAARFLQTLGEWLSDPMKLTEKDKPNEHELSPVKS